MGAVSYLPYAHSTNEAEVAIWNGRHGIVGHTTGANVTCELRRPNGLWYKVATGADLHTDSPDWSPVRSPGTYVSAAQTNLFSGPPGYVWGSCPDNSDQPGLRYLDRAVLITAVAVLLAAALGAGVISRRRRALLVPPALL